MSCPCFSGDPYDDCCAPLHGGRAAPTPEALMRSRYAAYALGKVDYVQATTHPTSPHAAQSAADLADFCERTRFVGLRILETGPDTVRFRAELRVGDRDASFEEHSRFARLGDRWFYVDRL